MILGKKESYALKSVTDKGDKTEFEHIQYQGHIQENCAKLYKGSDGFSPDRTYQHVARIPYALFLKVGHIIAPGGVIDEKALRRWLQTEEGRPYRTCPGNI